MTSDPALYPVRGNTSSVHRNPHPRSAVTLIELMLVLVLLVIIASLSIPVLQGSLTQAKLENGAELLRSAWTRARLAATESGDTKVFRFEQNGSRFQVISLGELGLPEQATIQPDETGEREAVDVLRLDEARLPDGVLFASADISASAQVSALTGGVAAGTVWSAPIVFRPDGTTSDAVVVLTNDTQQTIRVILRGLTGVSRIAEEEAGILP